MPTNNLKKLKIYFVPESYKNDVLTYREAESMIEATLVGIILLVFLFPFNYLLGLEISAWVALLDVAFLFFSLYVFKSNAKAHIFGNSLSFAAYIIVLSTTLETGGIFSPAMSAFIVSGVIAFFYAGKKLGFFWIIIALFTIGFLGAWESLSLSKLQSKISSENTIFLLLLLISYLLFF
jgi:hypothetical protein